MACYLYNGIKYTEEDLVKLLQSQQPKTRRILELQSDLFQKGRDKSNLIDKLERDEYSTNKFVLNGDIYEWVGESFYKNGEYIYQSKYNKALQEYLELQKGKDTKENEFLQLLNKDNNWVTFFVKSVIQDSAKKGYEKVLFPTGNTASKVEGHTTLEEFKKQKEDRIKKLEENKKTYDERNPNVTKEHRQNKIDFYDREINQLKQELERVETEGFDALKPIYKFYETTVANILKKQGYAPKQITDEYGNTWNEITINQARDLSEVLLQRNEANQIIGQANIKAMSVLVDAVNQKQDTLPHEYAHHYIAWYRNTPIVQEAIKKWGSEEALVQSIGEQVVKQKGEAYNWWKKFVKWIMNQFNSLSKLQKEELTQILTDAFLTRQDLSSGQAKAPVVKPGVDELFESNPELANAVYEALGFNQMITPNDKVVFGHPTIGKSYLKKQGEERFITLDDDYKDEVNAFVDTNRGSETRQEYKGRKPKEYNEFMLNLYDRLKLKAQREGKILFVSNTNILKERMSDFDKVITIPKAEFKRRFDERGATYGFEDWKSDIDVTIGKVHSNKVITTTGYLEDLFITPQQKQQAQQLYSQYLDTKNRLYRSETYLSADERKAPDWLKEQPEYIAQQEAQGRWFYKSLQEAQEHLKIFEGNEITYVDVAEDIEQYNARNNKFAGGYGREGKEYFVPKEIASSRNKLGSEKDMEGFRQWMQSQAGVDATALDSLISKLEQLGIIEKDCRGGGIKAKDGIRSKFTRGSQWELVKDLKGYPSHAQGGVDIQLGKDGFSFSRGEGQVLAAHGLVLPNATDPPVKDKIMAVINPKNWGVADYTDKGDFNNAYSSAKKAGEKEFMYNNKRYNTKYAGTPRQEAEAYGVDGKLMSPSELKPSAQVNVYSPSIKYPPGHIEAQLTSYEGSNPSVNYSAKGNYPLGLSTKKEPKKSTYNVYGDVDKQTFEDKAFSLPSGTYGKLLGLEEAPSNWNLFTNNCADNVCDAFGIPKSKGLETPKNTLGKIKDKYPMQEVTGRTMQDYTLMVDELKSNQDYDKILKNANYLLGLSYSPEFKNTKYNDTERNLSNEVVSILQKALNEKGHKLPKSIKQDGSFDGVLGKETEQALLKWVNKSKVK